MHGNYNPDVSVSTGLSATDGTIGHAVAEIERHLHSNERWFELAGTPDGEDHVAVEIGDADGAGVFTVTSGDDTWGDWLQILGADDTPADAGNTKFDLHRLEFAAASQNSSYFFQVAFGADGATALTAGDYTDCVFTPASNLIDSGPVVIQTERQDAGTKVWARCMCPGQDAKTLTFYVGLHEYSG